MTPQELHLARFIRAFALARRRWELYTGLKISDRAKLTPSEAPPMIGLPLKEGCQT